MAPPTAIAVMSQTLPGHGPNAEAVAAAREPLALRHDGVVTRS